MNSKVFFDYAIAPSPKTILFYEADRNHDSTTLTLHYIIVPRDFWVISKKKGLLG
ncbi:hypothetical protein [Paenibacillus crassostreae]|uniref:hypothetical protein n=1 Tax=Paenibacillus crassostreae TaxID=1763538 RepID=UPI0012FE6802|nr:hypothetical protein [Paenibacillus crassostreae]